MPTCSDPASILVVEDDRTTSLALTRTLTRAGHGITSAADGESALTLLGKGHRFDAVILDRRLPGVDGLEVLRIMKRSPDLCDIPVVMATVMDSPKDVWEGVRNGAFYYLAKPLNLDLVLQVVAAAVQDHAAERKLLAGMASARSAICLIQRGSFRYQTMQQCEELAALLANSCPDPQRTSVGLFELMLNALEHGNLGISYEEKTALIEARAWSDEMHRRQMLEENLAKNVTITLSQTRDKIRFKIQDMGAGFRHQDFQEMNPDRIFDNHGRGILLARWESFDKVEYQGNGNRVVMEVRRRPPQPRTGR